jgi:hypothetical protein
MTDKPDPRDRFVWMPGDITIVKRGKKASEPRRPQKPKPRGKTIEVPRD